MNKITLLPGIIILSFAPAAYAADITYHVKKDDTLFKIVADHRSLYKGTSFLQQLAIFIGNNPEIINPDKIYAGQTIILVKEKINKVKNKFVTYRVKKEDYLLKIVRRLYPEVITSKSLSYVKDINSQISNYNLIYPGQVIKLPSRENAQERFFSSRDRKIASVEKIFYYPDEVSFEIKKMSTHTANSYVDYLKELKNSGSLGSWINTIQKLKNYAFDQKHSAVMFAFDSMLMRLEDQQNFSKFKVEMKTFLEIWKKSRARRFRQ